MSSKPVKASRFPVLAVLCIALCGCMAPRAVVMPPANPLPVIPPSISPPPLPEPEVMVPGGSAVTPPEMLMPGPLPMEATALRMRLGNPDFIRREMDTELWRYDAARCSVFFFMQQQGGMLRLRYTETLPRGMTMAADPACIAALEQRMAAAPTLMNAPVSPP
jgi:hypothetical protein